jgi:biopolymer transport protein ExbD
MRFVVPKTFLRISILVVVVLVVLLVGAFVSRTMLEDSNIPSLLEPGDPPTETELIHRDPVVFAMDADGNVYQGRNVIGSLANTSDLTTKMREVIEASASRLAYTAGMDLNLQLPLRCTNDPVYIKAAAHAADSKILALIKALGEAGISQTRLIVLRDRKKAPP